MSSAVPAQPVVSASIPPVAPSAAAPLQARIQIAPAPVLAPPVGAAAEPELPPDAQYYRRNDSSEYGLSCNVNVFEPDLAGRIGPNGQHSAAVTARDKRSNASVTLVRIVVKENGFPDVVLREIINLRTILHPKLQPLRAVAFSDATNEFFLVFPRERTLMELLNQGMSFGEAAVKQIAQQMFSGLHFLNDFQMAHKNLCLQNISCSPGSVKLCEWFHKECVDSDAVLACVAPERSFLGEKLTQRSDVWSAGCVIASLLIGRSIFSPPSNASMSQVAREAAVVLGTPSEAEWPGFSARASLVVPQHFVDRLDNVCSSAGKEAIKFIRRMLMYDHLRRPLASSLLSADYLLSAHPPSLDARLLFPML